MVKSFIAWVSRLQRFIDKVWYWPLLAFVVGLDLFVLIVPSDGILVSTVMLRPKRWVRAALWVSVGSAIGALALAALLQGDVEALLETWLAYVFQSDNWIEVSEFLDDYGVVALSLYSFSLFPQQPAVALAALADMSLSQIFLAVFIGRFVKYGILAYLASHAPRYLSRLWGVRKELQELAGDNGSGPV